MVGHTVSAYEAELKDLTARIGEMGGAVEHQITHALDALLSGNREKAKDIIQNDDKIDHMDEAIGTMTISMIAKRQPMGDDLRTIVASMRVSQDLERAGDLAKNIAKRSLAIEGQTPHKRLALGVEHLCDLALQQLIKAINAFNSRDYEAAELVCTQDEEIDALYTSMFRELLTYMMEDTRTISMCTHLLFCAKNIERIGDHATNIAEQVYYIVRGKRIEGDRPKDDRSSYTNVDPQ